MNYRRSHFVFTSSQRNGIFVLVLIILILLGGMVWVNNYSPPGSNITLKEEKEIQLIQGYIDSIKQVRSQPKPKTIYPFNPNFITDYKGYTLGMTPEEIDRLLQYRSEDKWINSAEDFQKVTLVSDSLLAEISPYFKFPEWVTQQQKSDVYGKATKREYSFAEKSDLNLASAEDLMEINGIGEVLSKRIITYRTRINGFVDDIQIKDIYGLNYEAEQKLLERFTVKNPRKIEVLDINEAGVIELSEIIYFDYELAREIINFRSLNEGIKSFEELAKIEDFPSHKIDRIKLYLTIK